MSKFNKLINERGFLTKEAQTFVKDRFEKELDILLNCGDTEQEIRTIGSVLSSIIGTKVSNKISGKSNG